MAPTLEDLLLPQVSAVGPEDPLDAVPIPSGPVSLQLGLSPPAEVSTDASGLWLSKEWGDADGPGVYRFDCLVWTELGDRGQVVRESDINWQYVGESENVDTRVGNTAQRLPSSRRWVGNPEGSSCTRRSWHKG